ncbi:MAG: four helix bundle protein [Leptolyngbya sp. DLM2.Bin15]|nr:MAG: four helix bundle protein [Leptolyngbya sp. DLM2.Bin15]
MLDEQGLKQKTRCFAIQAIRLVEALPHGLPADELGRQFLRCATTLGIFCRHTCWRSPQARLQQLHDTVYVAEECLYWLELLSESGFLPNSKVEIVVVDITEILAYCFQEIHHLDRSTAVDQVSDVVPHVDPRHR